MHALARKSLYRYIPSTSLFVMPSFLKEIARIADFWGTLDEYRYYKTEHEADLAALRRDYEIVARNLKMTLEEYERRNGKRTIRTRNTRKPT